MHPLFRAALNRSGFAFDAAFDTPCQKRVVLGQEGLRLGRPFRTLEVSAYQPQQLAVRFSGQSELVPFQGESLLKPLLRFDFREEWNNLGYGATPLRSESPFSLTGFYAFSDVEVLAEVIDRETGEKVSDYAWVYNTKFESVLWFNREVGPIDGYDWCIIEEFFANYRDSELPCYPVVSEIPYGFSAAVTMRIDCDEAVASGRRLFELYRDKGFPFSMAIKTAQDLGETDRTLIRDVIASGGSVVGHSHTHAPNWGGSREAARWEIQESHRVLRSLEVPGINYDFVVSPFHQNPVEAVQGLKDAGISGFVGGIICNDPDFLMARAGQVPYVDGIISHSQQCMLHGETYQLAGHSLAVEKQAFLQAMATRQFFGFLDHPFSSYSYGWESEEQRLQVHAEFLQFISEVSSTGDQVWCASLVDALRFLRMKSCVHVETDANGRRLSLPSDLGFTGLPNLAVIYKSQRKPLVCGGEVRLEA